MVSRVYHDNEEPTLRRYSSRGHGYPLSQDREMYSTQNHGIYPGHRQHMPTHESRNSEHSPDHDSGSRPRSRIPVACGRCRKRKIRCSGDTGGPCTNCKQAGNNDCAFLRVSSTEAQMKSETSYEYDPPGSAASRVNCRMLPYGPQAYGPHGGLPADSYNSRGASVANYQYSIKPQQYYAMPPFPEYNEETLDYGLQALPVELSPSQQLNNPSNYTTSYTRGWTPAPQSQFPKNPLFLEQADSTFNHGHLPYHGNSYPLRTSINQELKSTSLNPLGALLPVPVAATTDRVLPFPAGRPSQGGSYVRNVENFIPTTQTSLQHSDYSGRPVRSSHGLPGSEALPVTQTPYLSMSASSTDSMTSSQMGYNAQQFTLNQQNDENSSHQNEALYQQPHSNGELYSTSDSEPTYSHLDSPQSKRGSHSSHVTNIDVSGSSSHGNLVNGYQYVPPPHNETVYPIPSMSMPHHHNTSVTTQSRRLSSVIAAS